MTISFISIASCDKHVILYRLFLSLFFGLLLVMIPHLIWFISYPEWYPCKRYLSSLPAIFMLLCPSCLPGKFGKGWLIVVYMLCVPFAVVEALHFSILGSNIASETLYALFETSTVEAKEAILSYFNFESTLIVLLAFFLPLIPLFFLFKMKFSVTKKSIACVLFVMLPLALGAPEFFRISMMGRIVNGWQEYWQYKTALQEYRNSPEKHVVVPVSTLSTLPQTVIVVIGESATRHHLGLYGYHRPTTPFFSSMRDDLLIFTDIISRHGFTATNISAMLTVPLGKEGGAAPAIELFRQTGRQVFWISNHNTFHVGKGLFHLLYAANQVIPINPDGDLGFPGRYDERILPVLDDILAKTSSSGQRLIFMNIMGSHFKYSSRYPQAFNHFISQEDIPDAPWRDEKAKATINEYDNTIMYTDYILGEIVNRIHDMPGAALVYLSDHGQEVYDTLDHMGPGPVLSSRYFVDIPFIMWLSPSFRNTRSHDVARWQTYTDRPGVSDCLPSVLAEICGIVYDDPLRAQNILSVDFAPSDRASLGESYDARFPGRSGLYDNDFHLPNADID